MEITISRTGVRNANLIMALLAVVGAGGYYAWTNGLLDRFLGPQTVQAAPGETPAIIALTDLYSPDRSGDRTAWEEKVCANMTGDGCLIFHKMFASPIWNAPEGEAITVSSSEVVDMLSNGSQVWKVNLTTGSESSPVYIHVEQGETGQWLLTRVLFVEEAAKYQQ